MNQAELPLDPLQWVFRDETMLRELASSRFLWTAFLAFVCAFLSTGTASASCSFTPSNKSCAHVRSRCCDEPTTQTPIRVTAEKRAAPRDLPAPTGNGCPNRPGCFCCPQPPAAPQPKGHREAESTSEPARDGTIAALLGDAAGESLLTRLGPALTGPLRKLPAYLCNSRLLI
jgi:hypothetical protein